MVEDDKLLILKKMLSKMNWGGEGGGGGMFESFDCSSGV